MFISSGSPNYGSSSIVQKKTIQFLTVLGFQNYNKRHVCPGFANLKHLELIVELDCAGLFVI